MVGFCWQQMMAQESWSIIHMATDNLQGLSIAVADSYSNNVSTLFDKIHAITPTHHHDRHTLWQFYATLGPG